MNDRDLLRELAARVNRESLPLDVLAALDAYGKKKGIPCAFCGAQFSTQLCDFVIGIERQGWVRATLLDAQKADRLDEWDSELKALPTAGMNGPIFTCDAPLCLGCAKEVGRTTVTGIPEPVEWCPYHFGGLQREGRVIDAEQAERIRIPIWKRKVAQ